jgi:hypothetical protein
MMLRKTAQWGPTVSLGTAASNESVVMYQTLATGKCGHGRNDNWLEKANALGENLLYCHFDHHKSHM